MHQLMIQLQANSTMWQTDRQRDKQLEKYDSERKKHACETCCCWNVFVTMCRI